MNVSFLSSTPSFSGLLYNLKKVDLGVAELVSTQNLEGLKHLGEVKNRDYIDYLKAWSERNSRVKNPQFHVAISVRGREKSAEELLEISKKWLHQMGYKDVPALFFFHRDTDNNHIHIISSRVGNDGKKIKDSNEIRRGLSLIRELNGVDLRAKAKEVFLNIEGYKIATKAQYAALWTQLGYRVKAGKDGFSVYKEGQRVLLVGGSTLSRMIDPDVLDAGRASEIRGLIAQYSRELNREDLGRVLKDKHGLELVFYGKKDAPYGYSIIDRSHKKVYKGGDILPIKELLSKGRVFSDNEQLERVNLYAKYMLENTKLTSKELQSKVKSWGLYIRQGEVFLKKTSLGFLDEGVLERLRYNDRLEKASRFSVDSFGALEALAKFFRIRYEDIELVGRERDQAPRNLSEMLSDAKASGDLFGYLREQGVTYVSHEGHRYLLDLERGDIEEIESDLKEGYESKSGYAPSLMARGASIPDINVFEEQEAASSVNNEIKKRRRKQ